MKNNKLVLILGGNRSGKSEFAEQLAGKNDGPVTYIATLVVADDEMGRRVDIHRKRRPLHWVTVEEPVNIPQKVAELGKEPGVLLIDCLTGWLSNLLLSEELPYKGAGLPDKEDYIMKRLTDFTLAASQAKADVLVVSNEVGLGLVSDYPLGRAFCDISGLANRHLASAADEVYLVTAGIAIEIKSMAVNLLKED